MNRQFREIRSRSYAVSVGKSTQKGRNRTAVLAFDRDGCLSEAWILQGVTVFARLRKLKLPMGAHYLALAENCAGNKKMDCVLEAVRYMEENGGNFYG